MQLGNGNGTFQPPVYLPLTAVGIGTSSIVVSDFNGDGKADIIGTAFQAAAGADLGVALGNGDGTFQPVQTFVSTFPTEFGDTSPFVLADFNGDGRVDIFEFASPPAVQLGSSGSPTTTVVSSSLNPSTFDTGVTLAASVSPATAAGVVTFYYQAPQDGIEIDEELGSATLTSRSATLTVSALPAGANFILGIYDGSATMLPSESTALFQQVNPELTSDTLSSSPNPSTVGQAVTLAARIKPAAAPGFVTFSRGLTVIATEPIADGEATLTIPISRKAPTH